MSRLIKSLIAISLLVNISVAAYAAAESFETNVEVTGYEAKITGTADCSEGTEVSLEVVRPGKDIFSVVKDSAASEDTLLNNNVILVSQTSVDDENAFEYICNFDQNEKSGTYTLRVQVYGEAEVREKTFVFENASRKQAAQMSIQSDSVDVLEDVLQEYATDIDIASGEQYVNFSNKEKEYVLKNISKEKTDKKQEYIDSVEEINGVREMKALDKEGLKTLVATGDVTGVDASLISEYSKLTTLKKDLFIADLYSNIKSKETPDEIKDAFSKAITEIKKPAQQSPGGGGGGGNSSTGSVIVRRDTATDTDKPYVIDIPENDGFADMDKSPWAKNAVDALYERGIINGRSDNMFCPTETVTREEFLKIVIESLNIVGISEENKTFADVNTDAWYSHYVDTGIGCGIIKGISDAEFGVGRPITREDIAIILYRAVQYAEVNLYLVEENTFTDENDISDYAKDAVKALSCANVINGMDDGSFMPKKTATRAEATVMLYNLLYR